MEIKESTAAYCGSMSVQVYGCNHVAIEVDDLAKAFQELFRPRGKARRLTYSGSK
jgi:hypothetical protein